MDTAKRIQNRLVQLEISASEVAREIGSSRASVSNWVNGLAEPSGSYLLKLCKALECDPDWLLYGSSELQPPVKDEESLELHPSYARLAQATGLGGDLLAEKLNFPLKHAHKWMRTGVPVAVATSASYVFGINKKWVLDGEGEPTDSSTVKPIAPDYNLVVLEKLECRASMGTGIERMPESDQSIDTMTLSPKWLKNNLVGGTRPENIKLITGIGDSMQGTFESGDVLFVDVSRRTLDVDAVYVISRDGELFIKRVQRLMTGGYRIISDNPKYASQDLTDEGLSDLEVLGRVVGIWGFKIA